MKIFPYAIFVLFHFLFANVNANTEFESQVLKMIESHKSVSLNDFVDQMSISVETPWNVYVKDT